MMEFAQVLKRLRKERGWSQQDLAAHGAPHGLNSSYIAQVEAGQIRRPTPTKVMAFAKALGVEHDTLLRAAGYAPTMRDNPDRTLSRIDWEVAQELARLSLQRQRDLLPMLRGMRRR